MNWADVIEVNKKNHADLFPALIHEKNVALVGGGTFKDARYLKADIVVTINGHFVTTNQKKVVYWNNTALTEERKNSLKSYSFVHINVPAEEAVELALFCEEVGVPWAFFGEDDEMKLKGYLPTVRWPQPLMDHYGMSPLTGTSAIYHLLQHTLKELFITGMDLYSSCNDKNLPPQFIAIHEVLPQVRYLREQKERDGRLKFDIILDSLVARYPEFCSRIHELPLITNPAIKECLWPGIKVEPWTIQKVTRILQEIRGGSESLFQEIVDVVNTMNIGGSLERFAKGLIPTTHELNGKESSIHSTTGTPISSN